MSELLDFSIDNKIKVLYDTLPDIWIDSYREMTSYETNVIKFSDNDFEFLFDFTSELEDNLGSVKGINDDRVVVAYGKSKPRIDKRDANRMAGFLGQSTKVFKKNYDKGHYIGHSLGGGLDVNLFPQRKDINRGISPRGKIFRKMETYCSKNIGAFCFTRPIYNDSSWYPSFIEYGILKSDGYLWVEIFEN